MRVKGKGEPVTIYQPLGWPGDLPAGLAAEVKDWHQFLRLYRARLWDEAAAQLSALQQGTGPAVLYDLYADRLSRMRALPSTVDWDGVTNFETK